MKKVKVEIKGLSPLLMNNPASMTEITSGLTQKTEKYNLEEKAKKLAYKDKDGILYIPSTAIKGCIIGASSYRKFGKFSAKPIIAGGVDILPEKISLNTKEYSLDIRTVVIQRARVVKARPKVENWKATFELVYDESLINDSTLIKPILEEAGKRIGLLDFRPSKLGSFGMFEVTKWQEE